MECATTTDTLTLLNTTTIDTLTLLTTLLTIIGVLASALASFTVAKKHQQLEEKRQIAEKLYVDVGHKQLRKYFNEIGLSEAEATDLIKDSATKSVSSVVYTNVISKEDIQKEIDKNIATLKSRIDEVESRFPNKDIVEKVASVNEAILATQIENLSKTVEKLEAKLLSPWDVAKIVFEIIAALGVLFGIIFGLLDYIKPT